jgi:DNA modification methylase
MITEWANRIVSSGYENPDQLLANPYNFRHHPKNQKDAMIGTLDQIGWIQDVIVNKTTGHIIDGHLRVELALQQNAKVPVKYVELTEKEELIALATLDPIGALADQHQGELDQLIDDIGEVDNDNLSDFLAGLMSNGIEEDEETEGQTDEDDLPDLDATSNINPGDVWILGDHKVICGDSLSMEYISALMGDDQADCLWIDPPYNVDYAAKQKALNQSGMKKGGRNQEEIENDKMPDDLFYEFLKNLFTSCCSVLKPGAPFYVAHSDWETVNFRLAITAAGLNQTQCLVWVKQMFSLCRQDHHWIHEPILYGWKPGAAHKWYGEFNKTTVIDDQPDVKKMDRSELVNYVRELRNTLGTTIVREDKPQKSIYHPTIKPVRLITSQLKNSTRKGDIVIDFCGGSGSSLIACEKLGRRARVCELSPKYVKVIIKRWQDYTGQQATLEDTGQTFDEIEAP